jgi:hypothetical protein
MVGTTWLGGPHPKVDRACGTKPSPSYLGTGLREQDPSITETQDFWALAEENAGRAM